MDYIFLVAAVLISIYGYTFARWLGMNGNKSGMFGVFFLIVINLTLALYRIINEG